MHVSVKAVSALAFILVSGVLVTLELGKRAEPNESATKNADPHQLRVLSKSSKRSSDPGKIVYRVPIATSSERAERQTTIEFSNGEAVSISMIEWTPDLPPFYPTKRLLDMYGALVAEAESGSAAAARLLYQELTFCETAFVDYDEYQEALRKLREEGLRTYPGAENRSEKVHRGLDTTSHSEIITEGYEKCQGITQKHTENIIQWAELAAHNGDFLSMRTMANEKGFTPEGLEWYEKAWKAGHVSAADALSIWHRNGASETSGRQPDYLTSYAYLLVNYKVYEDALKSSGYPQAQNLIVSMDSALQGLGGYLSPQEQAQAENLAVKLLRENENCCFGGWAAFDR